MSMDERLAELEDHIAAMSAEERQRQSAKSENNPQAVFDLIRRGDAVGVAVALKKKAQFDLVDKNGMTPLHVAAAHDTRTIAAVLTKEANSDIWRRDRFGRLPLDIARSAGHQQMGDRLERLTYPQLYKGEKDGPVKPERIEAFDSRYKELGKPDTSPAFSSYFEARESLPRLRSNQRSDRER